MGGKTAEKLWKAPEWINVILLTNHGNSGTIWMSNFKISGVKIKEQTTDILMCSIRSDTREYTMCVSMYMIYGDRSQ